MKYAPGLLAAVLAAAAAGVPRPDAVDDGIKIDVTRHVDCTRKTRVNDVVSIAYSLSLADGTKVESTKPGASFKFTLGVGEVIEGWDLGLKDMCIGEKRTLTIPPEYAYGQDAVGPIPRNSTLVFLTELIAIDGVPNPTKPVATPTQL